jgi:hypothetical protein
VSRDTPKGYSGILRPGLYSLRPSFAPDNCVHAKFAEFTFYELR